MITLKMRCSILFACDLSAHERDAAKTSIQDERGTVGRKNWNRSSGALRLGPAVVEASVLAAGVMAVAVSAAAARRVPHNSRTTGPTGPFSSLWNKDWNFGAGGTSAPKALATISFGDLVIPGAEAAVAFAIAAIAVMPPGGGVLVGRVKLVVLTIVADGTSRKVSIGAAGAAAATAVAADFTPGADVAAANRVAPITSCR